MRLRLQASPLPASISIITAEEQNRGWLATIAKSRKPADRMAAYHRYHILIEALREWDVAPWTEAAEQQFQGLVQSKRRIGSMDFRIAAIALSLNAMVLTRNLRDFERVLNLKVEDWLS